MTHRAGGVIAAAFVGAALAGLPPVRDGLDRLSERVEVRLRAPRRGDIARAVRWYHEDRRFAAERPSQQTMVLIRHRVDALRPRERRVYAECARREARAAARAQPLAARSGAVVAGPWNRPPGGGSGRVSPPGA